MQSYHRRFGRGNSVPGASDRVDSALWWCPFTGIVSARRGPRLRSPLCNHGTVSGLRVWMEWTECFGNGTRFRSCRNCQKYIPLANQAMGLNGSVAQTVQRTSHRVGVFGSECRPCRTNTLVRSQRLAHKRTKSFCRSGCREYGPTIGVDLRSPPHGYRCDRGACAVFFSLSNTHASAGSTPS